MSKTASIHIRVESDLKLETERIFKSVGITTTEAIKLFLRHVQQQKSVPMSTVDHELDAWIRSCIIEGIQSADAPGAIFTAHDEVMRRLKCSLDKKVVGKAA
jgi:DNA-damage-inducible protein J